MVDKLLKDKIPATKLDLFHENGQLKIGIDYVVNTNNGYPSSAGTTRAKIPVVKHWNWSTNGESNLEYENYKEFLKSYLKLKYIYVKKKKYDKIIRR